MQPKAKPDRQPDIGTLNESSLHVGLKEWLAEPGDRFEVPVGEFVVDVVRGDRLIEIQTGSFGAMGRKLDHLLDDHRILLVHPIAVESWLLRDGMADRRSPRRGSRYSIFDELVSIPTLLDHPHLEVDIVLIVEEQVRRHGAGLRRGRGGWHVVDRRLREVVEVHHLGGSADLAALVPDGLGTEFSTLDIARVCGIDRDLAQKVAYTLRSLGFFEQRGRDRHGIRYARRG